MKATERDPLLYLEDMKTSMERVGEYIAGLDLQQFKWDYKIERIIQIETSENP